MEVSSQLHAPAALPHRKSPWYPMVGKLLSLEGCAGKENISSLPLLGIKHQSSSL